MGIIGKVIWNSARVMKIALATIPISIAPVGSASAAAGDNSAWQRAQEENTVLAYSEFILNHAESNFTDEAFCALYELNSNDATEVVRELKGDYPKSSVSFDTCATTSSARLLNI